MVIARVGLPRRKEAPPLVCVEPAQLPNEGVLAARGLSLVLPPADLSDERPMTSHVTLKAQLTNSCRRGLGLVHADALSRALQAVTQGLEISRDEVKRAQAEDKFCQSLKPGPASGNTEYFRDEGGLIFRRRKNGEHQLVVPVSLARRIVAAIHSPEPVGGFY